MNNSIYTTYITGISGNSLALIIFFNGYIGGADIGGGIYDGFYEIDEEDQKIKGEIRFTVPVNVSSITGLPPQAVPTSFQVPINLPSTLDPKEIYRIETPTGPVNVRFVKLRDME